MKLAFKQIEPFVRKPDPKARAILLYGPDDGLMRERTKIIGKTVSENLDDPFNVARIKGDTLIEEGGKLADEAHALSMMGDPRLIIVEDASDKITKAIKDYLADPSPTNLVLLQAGELGPRSSLRTLFEKADNAAALPCYVEDGQSLTNSIGDYIRNAGYQIDSDALYYLSANLVGDHGQMRSELDKLITYMGKDIQIKLDDARNNTGSLSEQKLDELVYACAGGQTQKAENLLSGLLAEGTNGVYVLRALQSHFRKLLYCALACESGQSLDVVIKSLQPPLFWKLVDPFKAQLRKWPSQKLYAVLKKINALEADLKKTGTPDELLLIRSIFGLSRMAA